MLANLGEKPLRLNEILRGGEREGLTAGTLSRVLRAPTSLGLVNREVLGTQPVAVQYTLTEKGRRIGPLLGGFQDLESDPDLREVQLWDFRRPSRFRAPGEWSPEEALASARIDNLRKRVEQPSKFTFLASNAVRRPGFS